MYKHIWLIIFSSNYEKSWDQLATDNLRLEHIRFGKILRILWISSLYLKYFGSHFRIKYWQNIMTLKFEAVVSLQSGKQDHLIHGRKLGFETKEEG